VGRRFDQERGFVRMSYIARHADPSSLAEMSHADIAVALAAAEGGKPLSVQRIQQIERRALQKLRALLRLRGINSLGDIAP